MGFNGLGLKKLIATCYATSPVLYTQLTLFGEEQAIHGEQKKPYKIEITEVTDENGDGRVDLSDVEYLLKNRKNALTLLQGNLEKTMYHLSGLINANVTPENIGCCRFITLTYQKNQRDPQQLYSDFKRFNQKFKRSMKKLNLQYEYIFVLEAQARGAFHSHCIFIFNAPPPFLDSSTIADMWGHGFVSIKALNGNADDIGRYLTAYLSDLPTEDKPPIEALDGISNIKEVEVDGTKKRILKNARLALIPAGTRIYRYSKGISKPVVFQAPYTEALEHLADMGYQKTYESALELAVPESGFKTQYVKQVFKKHINLTRKKKGVKHHEL